MRMATVSLTLLLASLSQGKSELPLNGSYQYKYLGVVPIFNAELHLPKNYENATFDRDKPLDLVFSYYRSIGREQLINQARIALEAGEQSDQITQFSVELEALNNAYRDVKRGDRYRLSYKPTTGMTLFLNDEKLLTIEGHDFPAFYLSIWLGDQANDSKLSQKLWAGIIDEGIKQK